MQVFGKHEFNQVRGKRRTQMIMMIMISTYLNHQSDLRSLSKNTLL
jgi:hypothetical protein